MLFILLFLLIFVWRGQCLSRTVNSMNFDVEDLHATSRIQALLRSHDSQARLHDQAITIISSLKLPESCLYSSLTESLLEQCSKSKAGVDGFDKTTFATKLAVCEFKAAGVSYPNECRDTLNKEWEIRRCVKKLESKPQWWTSWSNCLQSIGVMCQAVRGEADRDNLLNLHQNLTNIQFQLQDQLHSSLQDTEIHLEAQRALSNQVQSSMVRIHEEMIRVNNEVVKDLEEVFGKGRSMLINSNQDAIAGVRKVVSRVTQASTKADEHMEAMDHLGEMLANIKQTLRDISRDVEEEGTSLKEGNIAVSEHTNELLRSSAISVEKHISRSFNLIHISLQNLSTTVVELQRVTSQTYSVISELSKDSLKMKSSHESLQQAIELHQVVQIRHIAAIGNMATLINDTLSRVLLKAEHVLDRLDEAESRFISLESNEMLWRLALCLLTITGGALISKKWLGSALLFSGLAMYFWTVIDISQYWQDSLVLEHRFSIDGQAHGDGTSINDVGSGLLKALQMIWKLIT